MFDAYKDQLPDSDPGSTREWIESLESIVASEGTARAAWLMRNLAKRARALAVDLPLAVQTPYINTIPPEDEPPFPGDERVELRIRRIIRWNAAAMVVRANNRHPGIGGHLATYASAASLYEVGFNHFFRGKHGDGSGDQVFFQGHAAPGIYARAFLEGRLSEAELDRFRREAGEERGLSSYPHPRLMPDFWEFPSVSMGLAPLSAIYQARFNRYLLARGLKDTSKSRVFAFLGDGEMDEPEARGALALASREGLDNLIFVVNCNLQRLDGPVRGNGKIIQELEALFRGAGWHVIKVVWGREWDPLLASDVDGLLVNRMNQALDGDYQKYAVESGAYIRRHFFGTNPALLEMVSHLRDGDLERLRRGGHDYRKLYAAYHAAVAHRGSPTVILAKTVKGWTLGEGVESRNAAHQMKLLSEAELRVFRDRLDLPIPDDQLEEAPFYHPGKDSYEVRYLMERRRALGGCLPERLVKTRPLAVPGAKLYREFDAAASDVKPVSTTMALVRLLRRLLDDKEIGSRIVPIVPDEARTFGMDFLFKKVGIYSPLGQRYDPVDSHLLLSYNESRQGQIIEEGINEAGSMASFIAAGTSHASHGEPTIPFYLFYSMFGFQRTGDLMWAAGDQRVRGFLVGGTAGRTTLNGEGLQHQDGHSHLLASVIPCVRAYDPAFHYEVAAIVRDGIEKMYRDGEDLFYYLTVYNETRPMPAKPEGVDEGILRGIYLVGKRSRPTGRGVRLLASGSLIWEAMKAKEILEQEHHLAADLYSVTSYTELRRDALACEAAILEADESAQSFLDKVLGGSQEPIVAVSDYLKALPDSIARFLHAPMLTLGTDGFGRSDTRERLRSYFQVDAKAIVKAALHLDSRRQGNRRGDSRSREPEARG